MVEFIDDTEYMARTGQQLAEKKGVIRRLEAELDERRKEYAEELKGYRELRGVPKAD